MDRRHRRAAHADRLSPRGRGATAPRAAPHRTARDTTTGDDSHIDDITPPTRIRRPRRDSQAKADAMRLAAKTLFLRDGFNATSMDAVAQEAGVSKRTVYTHFGSKQELFAEVIRHMCAQVLPADAFDPADAGDGPAERLTLIATRFLEAVYSESQVRLYRTVVSDSRLYPEIGRMMYDGPVTATHRTLASYFERRVADGALAIDDCELAATQFIALIKTDVHMRLLFNHELHFGRGELKRLARRSVTLFLNGALPR